MSRFPGRQFTTPERQGYSSNPPCSSHTPSHHQQADSSSSRAWSGNSTRSHRTSRDEIHQASSVDPETTLRTQQDLMTRYLRLQDERDRYLEERDQARQRAEEANTRYQTLETTLQRQENQLAIAKAKERKLQAEVDGLRGELRRARQSTHPQSTAIADRPAAAPSTSFQPNSGALSRFGENFGFGIRPVAVKRPDPRESFNAPAESFESDPFSQVNRRPQSRVEWAAELAALFKKIETFCYDNLNIPNESTDREWPSALAHEIAHESSSEHVSSLINDRCTRYLLITRIIIAWIEAHYLHIKIIKGFSRKSDEEVQSIHKRLKTATSSSVRLNLAQAEADAISEITHHPNFEEWSTAKVREGVNTMMSRLSPTILPTANLARVGTEFEAILTDAWRIGLLMATRTENFNMWIPPSSAHTPFNPRCMLNRNPYEQQAVTPDELVRRGAMVSLGVTPHVTVTMVDGVEEEGGETRTVHLANVVLFR